MCFVQGVDNLPSIAASANGVMVARGDLGVEVPLAAVPGIQRRMIDVCMYVCI